MVVLQMDHDPASIGAGDAARREADAPRSGWASRRPEPTKAQAISPGGGLQAAVVAQLEDARRRVALRAALLGVFGTLSGAWLGASLPNDRARAGPTGAGTAGCTAPADVDRFAH